MVNVREGTNEELSPEIERQTCRKPVGEGKSMSDGYAMGLGVSSMGAVCAECVPMSTECSGRDDGGNWIDQFLMKDGAYNPNLDVASDTDFLPCRLQIVVIFVCRRNRTTARSVGILAHLKWSRENHQGVKGIDLLPYKSVGDASQWHRSHTRTGSLHSLDSILHDYYLPRATNSR